MCFFFFSSRRRHTRWPRDWSSDVCSSDLLSEVRRSLQQKAPMTLMLLHFGKASAMVKEIGESQVEHMMQQIGQALASHIRQNDVAVRYDLTTIALVLADTTEKNAFLVVDKMRKVLASTKIPSTDRNPPI